jgi:hypothetical protein
VNISHTHKCPSSRNWDASMLLQLSEDMMNGEFEALLEKKVIKIIKA